MRHLNSQRGKGIQKHSAREGHSLSNQVNHEVDQFLHNNYSCTLSSLTNSVGREKRELVEDSIGDALLSALTKWQKSGLPNNPAAWVYSASRNRLIDKLRRDRSWQEKESILSKLEPSFIQTDDDFDAIIRNKLLETLFCCFNQNIKPESSIILALHVLFGIGFDQIGRLMHKKPPAVAKAYQRAVQRLREGPKAFCKPGVQQINSDLAHVLRTIHYVFKAGSSSKQWDVNLCETALILTTEVLELSKLSNSMNIECAFSMLAVMCTDVLKQMEVDVQNAQHEWPIAEFHQEMNINLRELQLLEEFGEQINAILGLDAMGGGNFRNPLE